MCEASCSSKFLVSSADDELKLLGHVERELLHIVYISPSRQRISRPVPAKQEQVADPKCSLSGQLHQYGIHVAF